MMDLSERHHWRSHGTDSPVCRDSRTTR